MEFSKVAKMGMATSSTNWGAGSGITGRVGTPPAVKQ